MYSVFLEINAFQTQPAATTNDATALVGWGLGFAMALVVLALVARPLLTAEVGFKRRAPQESVLQEQAKIEALYERAAAERKSLEELEFDHELGNLEEADYATLKEKTQGELLTLEAQIKRQEEVLAETQGQREARLKAKTASPQVSKKVVPSATSARTVTRPYRTISAAEAEGRLKPAVKEAMKCSECTTPFKPGDRFCSKCGAPLPHLCLNCGAELTDDERFCAKCGAAVND